MKRTFFVVFLLLSFSCLGGNIDDAVQNIESKWAALYYGKKISESYPGYSELLTETQQLTKAHPEQAELYFWQAVLLATMAEHQNGINALIAINDARHLLLKAISIDPNTMAGSAYVTLGTLYYLSPGWPIAFGDKTIAEKYLKKGLKINPQGIDANYFYGDFLLKQNKFEKAAKYFRLALKSPARKEQSYADNQLKAVVKNAYQKLITLQAKNQKNLFASYAQTPTQTVR